jgi:hypothetical protein
MILKKVKAIVHRILTYFVVGIRAKAQNAVPKADLSPSHLANASLLANRFELLNRLPKGGVCAE